MTSAAVAVPKNRTTVRSPPWSLEVLRLALRSSAVVAPALADRFAARLFFKPRRPRKARAPQAPELSAQAFHVESSLGRLAAWSWGEGPLVVLAHGWEGSAAQLQGFVPPLVSAGFRVVAFDAPAHGRSEGTHTSVVDMARAIREVIEDAQPFVGLDRAPPYAVVAHSLGGAATVLALQDGLEVQRVVLLAPLAEPTVYANRAAKLLQLSPARAAGMVREIFEFVGRDFESIDGRRLAPRFRVPALIFHDEQDREVPFEHGRDIARAWPGAQLVPLQGLGHVRLLSHPEVIARATQFLSQQPLQLVQSV